MESSAFNLASPVRDGLARSESTFLADELRRYTLAVEGVGVEGVEELAYSDQELQGQIRKSAQVHFYRHQV